MKQTVSGNCSSQIKIKEIDMMYLMIKYILLTRSKLKKNYISYTHTLLQPDQNFLMKVKVEYLEGLLTQKHGMIVMKGKVEDLEGLLTQKHSMIVMKVKVDDLEGLGGQSIAGQRTGL